VKFMPGSPTDRPKAGLLPLGAVRTD